MKKRISWGTCIVIVFIFCTATFLLTVTTLNNNFESKNVELISKASFYDKLQDVYGRVNSEFVKDYTPADFEKSYLGTYIDSLNDPYSAYLSKEEMKEHMSDAAGNLVGIGVHVVYHNETGGIYITGIMPDSPALKAGLQPGDIIIQVEDIKLTPETYSTAVNTVKGEAGKAVNFVVKRGNEELKFSIVRAALKNETVLYEKINNSIAYVTIIQFDGTTAEQFNNVLEKAAADGCDRYIFDVRNNPGGDLSAITQVLDKLLPEGPIINIIDKKGETQTIESDAACLKAPMVVLANGNTASAAELFTAALRDYKLATIIGTKTFGKGSMQTTMTLADGSGLKLSTAFYNPPYGENYDGIGITPDIVLEMPEELMGRFYLLTNEEDNQLQKAISVIKDIKTND